MRRDIFENSLYNQSKSLAQNKTSPDERWTKSFFSSPLDLNFAVDVLLCSVRTVKSEALAFCLEMRIAPQGPGRGCCPKKKSQSTDVV